IAPLVAVIGLATLTNRHTVAYYRGRYSERRTVMLAAASLGIGLALLIVLAQWYGRPIANLILTARAVGPAAWFLRGLAQIMRRVPNNELAGLAGVAFWGALACGGALFCVLTLHHVGGDDPGWRDTRLGLTAIFAVGTVALGIAAYRLLLRAEQTLRKA